MTEQERQFDLATKQGQVEALRQEVAEMNRERESWNHYRNQAAIAAMQGMLTNPQTFEQLDHDERYQNIRGGDKTQLIAIASVMYADALIAELQKK